MTEEAVNDIIIEEATKLEDYLQVSFDSKHGWVALKRKSVDQRHFLYSIDVSDVKRDNERKERRD